MIGKWCIAFDHLNTVYPETKFVIAKELENDMKFKRENIEVFFESTTVRVGSQTGDSRFCM